jgi:hypothetical protein
MTFVGFCSLGRVLSRRTAAGYHDFANSQTWPPCFRVHKDASSSAIQLPCDSLTASVYIPPLPSQVIYPRFLVCTYETHSTRMVTRVWAAWSRRAVASAARWPFILGVGMWPLLAVAAAKHGLCRCDGSLRCQKRWRHENQTVYLLRSS